MLLSLPCLLPVHIAFNTMGLPTHSGCFRRIPPIKQVANCIGEESNSQYERQRPSQPGKETGGLRRGKCTDLQPECCSVDSVINGELVMMISVCRSIYIYVLVFHVCFPVV